MIGDGTYLMAPTELVTAAQEELKLTVVVLDNGGYGSIDALALDQDGRQRRQPVRAPRRRRPSPSTIAAIAEGFGCRGVRADDAAGLGRALAEARLGDTTTVIHCPTVPGRPLLDSGAFWDLGVPETAGDAAVRALAERHLRERAQRQRWL